MNLSHLKTTHYLKPAEIYFVDKPLLIKTILGSCITVTMFSQRVGMAAACHALMPTCSQDSPCYDPTCLQRHKYVDCIIPFMLKKFHTMGIGTSEIEVKLFGGADMFEGNGKGKVRVGRMNVEMARQVLANHGLRLKNFDVGGTSGRKIVFDTKTGEVWMKRLNQGRSQLLLEYAIKYVVRLESETMLLEVRASNPRAAALYENRGFRVIGRRPSYYQAGEGREDAIVMSFELRSARH